MQKKSDLLIIIPAYNEEASIEKVVNNLIYNYSQYDYVFINDGSKDQTLAVLRQLNQVDEQVRYLSFSRNFGKEAALYAGL